jgi:hypothetical protein
MRTDNVSIKQQQQQQHNRGFVSLPKKAEMILRVCQFQEDLTSTFGKWKDKRLLDLVGTNADELTQGAILVYDGINLLLSTCHFLHVMLACISSKVFVSDSIIETIS